MVSWWRKKRRRKSGDVEGAKRKKGEKKVKVSRKRKKWEAESTYNSACVCAFARMRHQVCG